MENNQEVREQQTAVQWLEKEMIDLVSFTTTEIRERFRNKFKQALAMEREQSIRDYCEGFKASDDGWNGTFGIKNMDNIADEINAEEYFTDTYQTEP